MYCQLDYVAQFDAMHTVLSDMCPQTVRPARVSCRECIGILSCDLGGIQLCSSQYFAATDMTTTWWQRLIATAYCAATVSRINCIRRYQSEFSFAPFFSPSKINAQSCQILIWPKRLRNDSVLSIHPRLCVRSQSCLIFVSRGLGLRMTHDGRTANGAAAIAKW